MPEVQINELGDHQIEELLEFLKKWGFDHPELGEGSVVRWQKCFRFVARCCGKIVGYIGQIPQQFKYGLDKSNKGIVNIGWGVTLVLDMSDDQIRKAAGRGLLTKCENNPPYMFTGVGIVPTIEDPYKRRGYAIRRDSSRMYARFIRPAKALRYMKKSALYSPIFKAANVIWSAPKKVNESDLMSIGEFDPKWDDHWDELLSSQYELYGLRNAKYLNYKLSQPNRSYKVFIHKNGGYIIYRLAKHTVKDMMLVKICDLVGTETAKSDLLGQAMKFLMEQQAYGIVAIGSVIDELLYKRAGMYVSRPYPIALNKEIRAKMHVTFFDSDLDNLW